MTSAAPALSASDIRRLRLLAICVTVIGLAVICFDLLYLYVPVGKAPPQGFAPDIGAAYARTVPIPQLTFSARAFTRISLALQAAMWASFFAAIALLRQLADGPGERAALKQIAVGSGLASVALILAPPSLSQDLYHYALFGRMILTRGLNPYVTTGEALIGDPIWELACLRDHSTHYGPLFTGLSVLAAAVGGDRPIATALAFKTIATAFGALAAWSIIALARQQRRSSLLPLGLVILNPLILIETPGSAHNEMIMMGLALAGLVVAGRGRPNLGYALIVGSVHVKWVTACLAGLIAIARLRETSGLPARARELARLLGIAVGVSVLLYLPFLTKADMMGAVRSLLGGGHAGGGMRASQFIQFGAVVLGAIVVVARSGRRHLFEMSALACFGFVLFVFPWWMPWYLIPTLVLLAVGTFGRLNGVLFGLAMVFTLFLMANWAVLLPR